MANASEDKLRGFSTEEECSSTEMDVERML